MRKRVKIEYDGSDKTAAGIVTTEHAASSYGQPVIVIGGAAYGPMDMTKMGASVATSDRAVAERLVKAGVKVRLSDPQSKWQAKNIHRVTASLTNAEHERLTAYCEARGIAINAAIKEWVNTLDARDRHDE